MSDGAGLPSTPGQISGLPSNFQNIAFESFEGGLNTQAPRPAIKDTEMAWCDGYMPYAPNTLRILWGAGPTVYTAAGATVVWFGFGNIGDTPYGVVLQSDGAIHVFNTDTGGRLQVMGASTITKPSSFVGFSQWGSEQLIFAKDQTNGYWLWDGANLFTATTLGPEVELISGGDKYTGTPSITLRTTGVGTGTSFSPTIQNQSVAKVTVVAPGSAFGKDDLVVADVAGGGSDDQAIPLAPSVSVGAGGLDTIFVNNGGNGYTNRANVVITGGGGSGATISLSIQNGTIIGGAVVETGTGYTTAPTLAVSDPGIPGSPSIPGGTGASLFCSVAFGQVTGIGVSYGGSNYTDPPTVRIVGDGTGAAAFAVLSGGQVTGVQMTAMGKGYTVAIASFEGGNNAANVRPRLMPFGLSGTTVEVYQQRVWISNGSAVDAFPPKNRTIFSSADSAVNFGDGGGAFQSRDSFLRVGYHWLKQSNGFLYLGGDSSVNYVSGVTTSTPSSTAVTAQPITTFGNQNVDPQLGSPWPSSVQVFSRNIVFANSLGIFVSYGGAVQKVSEPLDGFYATGSIFGSTSNFSSAVANIFGIAVYMLLLPVTDLRTGALTNKLLMWTGKKWFTSQQDVDLTYIATQEINSVMTAWGTDGTNIFRLFQTPSVGFQKSAISKLFSNPAYWTTKTATRLSGVAIGDGTIQQLAISIDNELGTGAGNASQGVLLQTGGLTWNLIWGNLAWGSGGLDVFGPYSVAQQGRMLGMSVVTNMGDGALLSLNLGGQVYGTNI
jgi:hypothetical protein